ncbi:MAG: hypothetical protein Q9171_002443 [Xanthocarpia ochracea]
MAISRFESEHGTNTSLANGRRNCGETRRVAATCDISEETGFPCRLFPLNLATRAPPTDEIEQLDDKARFQTGICEPLTLQVRRLGESEVKLIWWYIEAVNEDQQDEKGMQEKNKFAVEFYSYSDVLSLHSR